MKSFTSIFAAAVIALSATSVQAQTMIPWDENGKWSVFPEQLTAEGGISYDEDSGCYVSNGTEGKLLINLEGKTIDLTEVAKIEVMGPSYKEDPWGDADPLATLTINDVNNGRINRWFGSRYNVDYKSYAANSAKVDSIYWDVRFIAPTTETEEGFYRTGDIIIDEIIFTKSVEQDPKAITELFWHEWDGFEANSNIVKESGIGCGVRLNEPLGGGAVFAGPLAGVVPGNIYADLTPYAGIYIKGTPGTPWRGLFNRQSMEDAGDYINLVVNIPEDGELYIVFAEVPELKDQTYIHLNSSKINWGAPDGAKIAKFNYIEKGTDGICDIIVDDADADAPMYNVLGQRVNADYKGLVIKNGKKFINK